MSARASDPQAKRAEEGRRDDLLALMGVLGGIVTAFLGRHVLLVLVAGCALGLGGVLLATRGGRPIQARGWVACAFVLGLGAALAVSVLEVYQEWEAGQWLAEGPQTGQAPDAFRNLSQTAAGLRIASLAGGLCFLLGAVANKMDSGNEKGPGDRPGPSQ
jgi:hypothetical protein